jgi:hypothetical protein
VSGEPDTSQTNSQTSFDDIFKDLDLGDDTPAAGVKATGEAVHTEIEPPVHRRTRRTRTKVEIIVPEKVQILAPVSQQTLAEMQAGADYLRKRGAI